MTADDLRNRRLGIVSHVLPPSPSGQAVVLYRLLSETPPERYFLVSREDYRSADGSASASRKLPGRYYRLTPPRRFRTSTLPGVSLAMETLNASIAVLRRARQIAEIAREERCGLLVGCTGDLYDLPATALAARWAGLPFVPYIFDDYRYQWTGTSRKIAACLEPAVLRSARAVIVPNEFALEEYSRRCGAPGVVVRNPCLLPDLADLDRAERVFGQDELHIVYTGAVYHAQTDAFRNLIAAVSLPGHAGIRLHIYTAQSDAELEGQGIAGPMVTRHPHVPQAEVASILRQADILFLPLAFRSPIGEVIRTSAPGKTGEYLAAGRPILVHAPGDSFLSWYFRANGCGVVADREDPVDLGAAIERLRTDRGLRDGISDAARRAAERDFDLDKIRKTFDETVEEILSGSDRGPAGCG